MNSKEIAEYLSSSHPNATLEEAIAFALLLPRSSEISDSAIKLAEKLTFKEVIEETKNVITLNTGIYRESVIVKKNDVIDVNGYVCIDVDDAPAIQSETDWVNIKGQGILVLVGGWKQPCIGPATILDDKCGWSKPEPPSLDYLFVQDVMVICISRVPSFSIGGYGFYKLPAINCINGGHLICPEALGKRIMLCDGTEPIDRFDSKTDAYYKVDIKLPPFTTGCLDSYDASVFKLDVIAWQTFLDRKLRSSDIEKLVVGWNTIALDLRSKPLYKCAKDYIGYINIINESLDRSMLLTNSGFVSFVFNNFGYDFNYQNLESMMIELQKQDPTLIELYTYSYSMLDSFDTEAIS